jgi:hypothetical protein
VFVFTNIATRIDFFVSVVIVDVLDSKTATPLSGWKISLGFKSPLLWKSLVAMVAPRYGCAVVMHHCIYIMGGHKTGKHKGYQTTDSVDEYNPLTNKWCRARWTLPEPMSHFGANYDDANKSLMICNGITCYIRSFDPPSSIDTNDKWTKVKLGPSILGFSFPWRSSAFA